MSIKLTLTDTGTGVPMDYHVVSMSNVQWENNQVYVTVRSWFSQDAYESSKRALAETPVLLPGLPVRNGDLLDWIQAQLILPVDPTIPLNTYVNRWQFSGGEIVDHRPQPDVEQQDPAPTPTPIPSPTDVSQEPSATGSDDSAGTQATAGTEPPHADDSGTTAADPEPTEDPNQGAAATDKPVQTTAS